MSACGVRWLARFFLNGPQQPLLVTPQLPLTATRSQGSSPPTSFPGTCKTAGVLVLCTSASISKPMFEHPPTRPVGVRVGIALKL